MGRRGCQTRAGGGVVRAFRAVALLAGVAVVALLPLYGDVRPSAAVSHPEWARMVLRGLDLLADAPGVNDTAAQAFATLSGRDSRSWPADRYVRGQRVETFDARTAPGGSARRAASARRSTRWASRARATTASASTSPAPPRPRPSSRGRARTRSSARSPCPRGR